MLVFNATNRYLDTFLASNCSKLFAYKVKGTTLLEASGVALTVRNGILFHELIGQLPTIQESRIFLEEFTGNPAGLVAETSFAEIFEQVFGPQI